MNGTFLDAWVVDRTMFEYVNQGGCSCCGAAHAMMDFSSFLTKCSDWESDDHNSEKMSPWPGFIHDEILADRVKIRRSLKNGMSLYNTFMVENEKSFSHWWDLQDDSTRKRIFQAPVSDVMESIQGHINKKRAYNIVLCAVVEQVKCFAKTGYVDGRTETELYFENILQYEKGAFIVPVSIMKSNTFKCHFLKLITQLGGPKLLPYNVKGENKKKDLEFEPEKNVHHEASGQSFRSDRRITRLVIFREFATCAIRQFTRYTNDKIK